MEPEKRFEVRLAAFVKRAQVKTEYARQEQEDNNEDISDGRMEITVQFPLQYGLDVAVHDWPASPWLA